MPSQHRRQLPLALGGRSPLDEAVEVLAAAGAEGQGAIFTRREVVEFILDLAGYTSDQPLYERRLLEPSLGDGDFLIPALERLFASWQASGKRTNPVLALRDAVRGVELHRSTFGSTRARTIEFLRGAGLTGVEAQTLADSWLVEGDFLLTEFALEFTHVIGNPPYVRQELIPDILMEEYRSRYKTIYDRADLYVPFIEQSLSLLAPNGKLGFICADRWMKNRYGRPLRQFVSKSFHLEAYVDMVDTDAFHSDVIAYPAIFVISNQKPGRTRVARRPEIAPDTLSALAAAMTKKGKAKHSGVEELEHVADTAEPWPLDNTEQLAVIRRLERDFPLLEDAGCKVGIGVATGADKIFVGPLEELDVEDERKLPLVMTRDIDSGKVAWRGLGVLNPFGEDGAVVKLSEFPRFARYMEEHGAEIRKRHVSKKNPGSWFRTIDRIYPELTRQPKLLIPDIKGQAHIVYEDGNFYPHHNLYYVTSTDWDLHALQAVLQSRIGQSFVETYSTRMRGGYLRFQAQYLRRIRLPLWRDVSAAARKALMKAAEQGDADACNEAVSRLYGLSKQEELALRKVSV